MSDKLETITEHIRPLRYNKSKEKEPMTTTSGPAQAYLDDAVQQNPPLKSTLPRALLLTNTNTSMIEVKSRNNTEVRTMMR